MENLKMLAIASRERLLSFSFNVASSASALPARSLCRVQALRDL